MLRGSLPKFEAVDTADAFFAAVPASGEIVFDAGDRAKLGSHTSGGTGAMTNDGHGPRSGRGEAMG